METDGVHLFQPPFRILFLQFHLFPLPSPGSPSIYLFLCSLLSHAPVSRFIPRSPSNVPPSPVDSVIRMHYERLSHSPAHISRPLSRQNVCTTPTRLRYRFPMLAQRYAVLRLMDSSSSPLVHRRLLMLTLLSNFLISFIPVFPPPRSPRWTIVVPLVDAERNGERELQALCSTLDLTNARISLESFQFSAPTRSSSASRKLR